MGREKYARFAPSSYATVQEKLTKAMVSAQVGRNGWPVMMALCHKIYADGRLGRASADQIARRTGLTHAQISRGMSELRGKGIVVPVIRKTKDGCRHLDRSAYGHVAQYCITRDLWNATLADRIDDPGSADEGSRTSGS